MFMPKNATKQQKNLLQLDLEGQVQDYKDSIDITNRPILATQQLAALTLQNEQNYGFLQENQEETIKKSQFMVNTFWSIGMSDPFPDESTILEQESHLFTNVAFDINTHVYPSYKYKEGQIPFMIFIPSKQLMMKLMRSCIGCSSPRDLWFNNR